MSVYLVQIETAREILKEKVSDNNGIIELPNGWGLIEIDPQGEKTVVGCYPRKIHWVDGRVKEIYVMDS